MSIYSGFATRHQQQAYDNLISDLIYVLQKRILKFYSQQTTDQIKFFDIVLHLHTQLAKMEQNKYLEPKTSKSFEQLLKFLVNNTEGVEEFLENKNHHDEKQSKKPKHVMPQLKARSANTVHLRKATKTHRDSFSQLNEPTSIGKIVRQINSSVNDDSLGESRHKIILNGLGSDNDNILENPYTPRNNPEQNKEQNSRILGKYSSQTKKQSESRPRDLLLEYLQKNNKNYLRGYRKRAVRPRNTSISNRPHFNI